MEDTLMTDCKLHAGVEKTFELIRVLLDEREKQQKSQELANQEALRISRDVVDKHFEIINKFQQRMERLENTFATKVEVQQLFKFVYIGIGVVLAFQMLIKFIRF